MRSKSYDFWQVRGYRSYLIFQIIDVGPWSFDPDLYKFEWRPTSAWLTGIGALSNNPKPPNLYEDKFWSQGYCKDPKPHPERLAKKSCKMWKLAKKDTPA